MTEEERERFAPFMFDDLLIDPILGVDPRWVAMDLDNLLRQRAALENGAVSRMLNMKAEMNEFPDAMSYLDWQIRNLRDRLDIILAMRI